MMVWGGRWFLIKVGPAGAVGGTHIHVVSPEDYPADWGGTLSPCKVP